MRESGLHPYDGRKRIYRNSDSLPNRGRSVAARLIGLSLVELPSEVLYELSIYSGGTGVFDQLAIALPSTSLTWKTISQHLEAHSPEASLEDPEWGEEFVWLITSDEAVTNLNLQAREFVNSEKRSFQSECSPTDRLLFGSCSTVNDWTCIWGTDSSLNYLGFSQG